MANRAEQKAKCLNLAVEREMVEIWANPGEWDLVSADADALGLVFRALYFSVLVLFQFCFSYSTRPHDSCAYV
jgi:hypothetical protein